MAGHSFVELFLIYVHLNGIVEAYSGITENADGVSLDVVITAAR